MKKILALLGAVGLIVASTSTAVSCGNIKEEIRTTSLRKIIKNRELGEMLTNPEIPLPTEQEIIDRINELNNITLDLEEIEISITKNLVLITANDDSKKYHDSLFVNYTVNQIDKIDLNDLLKNNQLGNFMILDALQIDAPFDLVMEKLKDQNDAHHLDENELVFKRQYSVANGNSRDIKISPEKNSRKYTGEANISYTVKAEQKVDLKEKFPVTNFEITDLTRTNILFFFMKYNLEHLNDNDLLFFFMAFNRDFIFSEITETSTIITVKPYTLWFIPDSIELTYQLVK